MMNLYTAEKIAHFEHEERVRAATNARAVKELRREQAKAANPAEQPREGLLRRLVVSFGRH